MNACETPLKLAASFATLICDWVGLSLELTSIVRLESAARYLVEAARLL